MRGIMAELGVEDGLSALGYTQQDLPALVEGALPQVILRMSNSFTVCMKDRVNKLAPRYPVKEDLHQLYQSALSVY